jgi:hypothetical protein
MKQKHIAPLAQNGRITRELNQMSSESFLLAFCSSSNGKDLMIFGLSLFSPF